MTPEQTIALVSQFIASLGFPIFVAVYLLIYHKKALEETRDALVALKESVDALHDRIGDIPTISRS